MTFTITFLGTSGTQPTKERNLAGFVLSYKDKKFLFDCGEGTQRQLKFIKLAPTKIQRIFLTHLHGDHCLGIPGFIRNLAVNQYNKTLQVHGPRGTKGFITNMLTCTADRKRIKITTHTTKNGIVYQDKELIITALLMNHSVPCYGYRIQEKPKRKMNLKYLKQFGLTQHPLLGKLQQGKTITYKGNKITPDKATTLVPGKSVTYITDTAYCKQAATLAKDTDLLILESTFAESEKTKAKEYKHLTAKLAAKIAQEAQAKKLVLTHFSQRYKSTKLLVDEAKTVFKKVEAAKDFKTFSV